MGHTVAEENSRRVCLVRTYTWMSKRVSVAVYYWCGKCDVLRICPLWLLLHLRQLSLYSQEYTKAHIQNLKWAQRLAWVYKKKVQWITKVPERSRGLKQKLSQLQFQDSYKQCKKKTLYRFEYTEHVQTIYAQLCDRKQSLNAICHFSSRWQWNPGLMQYIWGKQSTDKHQLVSWMQYIYLCM